MTAQYSLSANKGIRRYVLFLLALFFVSAYYIHQSGVTYLPARLSAFSNSHRGDFHAIDKWRKESSRKKASKALWKNLTTCLQEGKPTVGPPHHGQVDDPSWVTDPAKPNYKVEMSTEDINAMRTSHAKYQHCSSALSLDSAYLPGQKGIVTTAGGKYIPVFLVSLRLLRKSGSTIPVEVFLANEEEYEPYFCESILPSLNARCRILSTELGTDANFTLESYQFKIFSILLSSFEDVLFLDADNLALNDPKPYFESPMYQGYGMILWPDFWDEFVSPIFYSIQGKQKPSSSSPGSRTCETGQILISKRKAGDVLLLATLYNVYGPKYYYPLLSQGSQGEGDKETFAAAAIYLEKPYYLVEKGVAPLGYFAKEEHHTFRGVAMLQFDPIDDFNRVIEGEIRPAFIHANFPKFDPYSILDKGVTKYFDNEAHRIWHDFENKHHVISWGQGDPEAQVWKEMIYIACHIGDKLRYTGAKDVPHCDNLKAHYKAVFGQSYSG